MVHRPIWYAVNIDIQKNGSHCTADEADLISAAKTTPFFTNWQRTMAFSKNQGALKWPTFAY